MTNLDRPHRTPGGQPTHEACELAVRERGYAERYKTAQRRFEA